MDSLQSTLQAVQMALQQSMLAGETWEGNQEAVGGGQQRGSSRWDGHRHGREHGPRPPQVFMVRPVAVMH